ncbi:hypothetical protein AB0M00_43945 [Streptomyces chartreusis]|uniref:hypothetical protein n=1 Tax=Streptomyces chartreusis TaxID=1969 RepID=UPI00343AC815
MTTVTGKLIGASNPQRVEMRATLVDVTGKDAVGYVASVPGELVRPVPITPGNDGAWTATLTANSLIESDAGDTLWAIQEGREKDGTPIVTYVAVPDTGSHWVGSIRADLSDTITGGGTVVYLPGPAGADGEDGASAYEVAVANGFVGSEAEWLASLVGPPGESGSGGGAVDSVNGLTGAVVLDAAAVDADPEGAAAAAQAAAISAAATDATARVTAHSSATDPHGDRAYADGKLAKTANLSDLPDPAAARTSLGLGNAATRNVGTTTGTVTAGDDSRLTDARTPTAHAASHATGGSDPVTAAAIGADPAGTATTAVTTHTGATDPHGDRSWADSKFATTTDLGTTNAAVTDLDAFVQDCLTRVAAIEQGTAWLAGVNSSGPVMVSGADLTVKDNDKGYRFRRGGSALDLEATGADLLVSNWSGTGFNGTQRAYLRLSADAQNIQVAGPVESVAALYGAAVHKLDPATGVASLGGKNGLTAVRFAGLKATPGAPTTGDWTAGDTVADSTGAWWLCTASGTPGTWTTGALPSTGGIITGNLAVTGNAFGQDTPSAHGIAAWCYDPALAVNSTALSNGILYLTRVNIAADVNVTKLYWWVGNSGSSPVSGQNQVGLYSSAGTLLASTTVDSAISTAGFKTTTITSQALTAGAFYWVAMVFNASVAPTLTRASGWTGVDTAANLGQPAASSRFATNGSSRTALPSTITPASNVGTDFAGPWAAVGA